MTARSPLAAASDPPDWAVVGWASGSGCGLRRGPVPGLHRWSRSPNELPRRAAPRREVQHPERARPGRPRQRSLPTVVEFWHDRAA